MLKIFSINLKCLIFTISFIMENRKNIYKNKLERGRRKGCAIVSDVLYFGVFIINIIRYIFRFQSTFFYACFHFFSLKFQSKNEKKM